MRLVFGQDQAVGAWVVSRIPHVEDVRTLGPFAAIGVADDEKLMAGCVFHNYAPAYGNCEISFAADTARWATRGTIRALLSVPFQQYGCRRVSLVTPHDNERAQRFIRGIGFVREGCARDFFAPKRHAVLFGLLRREFDRLFTRKS